VSTLNRIVPLLLLLLTGLLFAASPAKAETPRIDVFAEQALATCYDDGLAVLSETPDVSRPAGVGAGALGDDVTDGALLGSLAPLAYQTTWTPFAGPVAQPAPRVSHPPCAEPSTGPPSL
jgi:hypothetical protein